MMSVPAGTGRVERATLLALFQVSIWGFFLYGFGPSVPLLRDELGVSSAVAALHSTLSSFGAILAGTTGALSKRFGRGRIRWIGLMMLAIGAITYITGPNIWFTLAGALIAGTGGSAVVNTVNVSILTHHGNDDGPRWTVYAHALAATVGIISPLLIGFFVAQGLGWRPGFLAIPLAVVVLFVWLRKHTLAGDSAAEARAYHEQDHVGGAALTVRFWWLLACLLAGVAVEFCVSLWSTDVVRQQHALNESQAALSFSGFLIGVTIARWFSGRLAKRTGVDVLVFGGLIVMVVGLILLLVTSSPLMAFGSLLLVGLGNGPHYPFVISKTIEAAGAASDRAASIASVALGITVMSAPFALGAAADRIGVINAFVAVPVLALTSLLCLVVARSVHRG